MFKIRIMVWAQEAKHRTAVYIDVIMPTQPQPGREVVIFTNADYCAFVDWTWWQIGWDFEIWEVDVSHCELDSDDIVTMLQQGAHFYMDAPFRPVRKLIEL